MTLEKSNTHLLIVDDEAGMRDMLRMELEGQGYRVVSAANGQEALKRIRTEKFDLVITDFKMPQMDGMTLLENIKSVDPELEVIIATGHGTIESAVMAIKAGAYDFILKPFNLDELNILVEKALEKRNLKAMVGLYEASNAVFSTLSLDRLLEIVMDLLEKVLGADESSIMLINEQKKLSIVASRGLSDEIARDVQIEIGKRIAGTVAKEQRARLLIDGLKKYPEFKNIQSNKRIHSSIVCPLVCQGSLLGVLNISRTKNKNNFTGDDLVNLSVFASQAALAIQNAKLYDRLQKAYREIENTQAQLIQSEKLTSIGRLVAGVAHELNNPLTAVIGYSQLATESHDLGEIQRHLPIIASQAQRCSNIVKGLLLFARHQKPNCEAINPSLLLEDILQGISLELQKRKITIKKDFSNAPLVIEGDSHLLKQVFLNILTNAYQALEEISGERVIEIKLRLIENNAQFSFRDNGPGIPKEIVHKIFDPFYTTKEVGKGTGLGLSLSYGIIKEHRGTISVESESEKGATFIIALPLKAKKEEVVGYTSARLEDSQFKLPAGSKILIVEDEEAIRNLIIKIFDEQHYEAEMVEDGQVALEKLKVCDYDLVLCDYRMPRLNGVRFYEQAVKIKPELKGRFLFVTGSTEFMRDGGTYFSHHSLRFLLKPFTRNELISAVNAIMKDEQEKGRGSHHENA